MVFYLKINTDVLYAYKNLQIWVNAISKYGTNTQIFIVCENKIVEENIKKTIDFKECDYNFISSHIYSDNESIKKIISIIPSNGRFVSAGCAHLATFAHAKENKIDAFWNIDADDTRMCLADNRIAEALRCVEKYCRENNIDMMSLDMHESRKRGIPGWTFGITYINNRIDWIEFMVEHVSDEKRVEMWSVIKGIYARNIDTYVAYLKYFTDVKIKSFYFENMRFIHYYVDFFDRLNGAGFLHWSNGWLCYPILYYILEERDFGSIPISKNCHKFDICISDIESFDSIKSNSSDWRDIYSEGYVFYENESKRLRDFFIESGKDI